MSFTQLPLRAPLLEGVAEFETMTDVQAQAIPVLLQGRDVQAQSRTGSGKTVAFALPLLQRVALEERRPQAMVLCPTRELCAQVAREIRKVGRKLPGLSVVVLAGGTPGYHQRQQVEQGAHVIVGTPGRVQDFLHRKVLDVRGVGFLVLDEADRMLDMGFEEQVAYVLERLPNGQRAFFSATFPESLETYLTDPVAITISGVEPAIEEYEHANKSRTQGLEEVLASVQPEAALVFCNMKATVNEVVGALTEKGYAAAALHGDLEQPERDRVLARFRNHSVRVLVATDVAARGLDIDALDLVVNYDVPKRGDTYTHRIGRTGRAGKAGVAVTLVLKTIGLAPFKLEQRDGERAAAMETIYITGGRQDKLRAGDVLGALTKDAGLAGKDVGKIDVQDRLTYVAVTKGKAAEAIKKIGKIKGKKFKIGLAT